MKIDCMHKWLYCLLMVTWLLGGCGDFGNDDDDDFASKTDTSTYEIANDGFADSGDLASDELHSSANFPEVEGDQDFFYLSYDESASTASVEIVKSHVQDGNISGISRSLGRPWEFLNAETFAATDTPQELGVFQVSMELLTSARNGSFLETFLENHENSPESTNATRLYELGVHVQGPTISASERRHVVLTLLVDISGSMNERIAFQGTHTDVLTLMDTVKLGLKTLYDNLKDGDRLNIVTFDSVTNVILENFEVQKTTDALTQAGSGTTNFAEYESVVDLIQTAGSTNLNQGLEVAYELAKKYHDSQKINRVILLTDAYVNDGEVDPRVVSENTKINETEGIYFAGVGMGGSYNESFLNQITEAGKGSYFSVLSTSDITRIFSENLDALMNVAAREVRFRIDHPQSMTHLLTAAEEVSSNPDAVKSTNFSYNTDQYFYEVFQSDEDLETLNEATLSLHVVYRDPLTFEPHSFSHQQPISELIQSQSAQVEQARVISVFALLVNGVFTCSDLIGFSERMSQSNTVITEYQALLQSYCSGISL